MAHGYASSVREQTRAYVIARMPLVEMENEAPRPIDICVLGPDRVMSCPSACSQLIEQLWRVEIGRQAFSVGGGAVRSQAYFSATLGGVL